MLDSMNEFLESYRIFMENPLEVYVILELLPYNLQYTFIRNLLSVKHWFSCGDAYEMIPPTGLIRVTSTCIEALSGTMKQRETHDDYQTKTLIELPPPWVIE